MNQGKRRKWGEKETTEGYRIKEKESEGKHKEREKEENEKERKKKKEITDDNIESKE